MAGLSLFLAGECLAVHEWQRHDCLTEAYEARCRATY